MIKLNQNRRAFLIYIVIIIILLVAMGLIAPSIFSGIIEALAKLFGI